ncbi:hypothetical protein niasHT_032113 [Heterodera trifolii]|uniref:Uncharacterized protein n=1 Tax=Heterodera trifolii TaxID=157864 RepID=A0ABD2HR10_9BILA
MEKNGGKLFKRNEIAFSELTMALPDFPASASTDGKETLTEKMDYEMDNQNAESSKLISQNDEIGSPVPIDIDPLIGQSDVTAGEDELIKVIDEADLLTGQLRTKAINLEQEKESILDKINNIKASADKMTDENFLGSAEREELMLNMKRIDQKCTSVNVHVETKRNEQQSKALEQVNKMIESAMDHKKSNAVEIKQKIIGFLNACLSEETDGPIDQKFESMIIGCIGDDQKRIRLKLEQIVQQMKAPKRENTSKNKKKKAIAEANDLLKQLDEVDHLTDQLRANSIKLEQEKVSILEKINKIKAYAVDQMTDEHFSAEREELMLNMKRIDQKCTSVNVHVETKRNEQQSKALEQVKKMIESAMDHKKSNAVEIKQKIIGFLNACLSEEVGPIDLEFQSAILGCTLDDQKKIRYKLQEIVQKMH